MSLRRASQPESDDLAELWLDARRSAAPDIPLPVHDDAEVHRWFGSLVASGEVWVADCEPAPGSGEPVAGDWQTGRVGDRSASVVALMVLDGRWIDQLYVRPGHTGRGVGRSLLCLAKELRPNGLELLTFQSNLGARRFYERNGFVAVESTDGSGNEERAPDVRYRWQKGRAESVQAGLEPGSHLRPLAG